MAKSSEKPSVPDAPQEQKIKCGLVMPISALDGCTEAHWSEVKSIMSDAVEAVGFGANLVSDADDVGIIQKRIIHNLYDNPIVVVDVSGKNPNVMFELGMRLAFDKPTIIVKDDKTTYSFDTSPIEHLEYPRDLRFARIMDFKKQLGEKVKNTHEKATTDSNYTTFLKNFGKFTVAKLETTEVSKEDYILEELRSLRAMVARRNQPEQTDIAEQRSRARQILRRQVMEFLTNPLSKGLPPTKEGILSAAKEIVLSLPPEIQMVLPFEDAMELANRELQMRML